VVRRLLDKIRRLLKVRSPWKESQGYYRCEKCARHDDCICVVCEDGKTVVCNLYNKHVNRWHTCKYFKEMKNEQMR
jgi:hypothetical protein